MWFHWKTRETITLLIIQLKITRERVQRDYNAYSIECNVILLENKGINDIANHLMEFDFTRKTGSRWATIEYHQRGKESVGFQCIFNWMQLNATEIKEVYNIDGQPKKYQQRKSEAIGIQFIFNWIQCYLLENKGNNDIDNHSMGYHQGRKKAIGFQCILNRMQCHFTGKQGKQWHW